MIAVRLEGRLGNQLFQYAFAYATAQKLNTSFYLDKSVDKFLVPQYFEVKQDFPATLDNHIFSIRGFKNIFFVYLRRGFYRLLRVLCFGKRTVITRNEDAPALMLSGLKNNHFYIGFFQSEDYFAGFQNHIRELFQIKPEYITAFDKAWKMFSPGKKKAVVHIRRGDYVTLDITLPLSYYKDAIATIGTEGVQYIFVSDDPDFIRQEFGYIEDIYISAHNEIIDLQMLSHAHFCILSNSSFSWWGAWLNTNPEKIVFAPQYWLGFKQQREFPVGIGDRLNFNWIPA